MWGLTGSAGGDVDDPGGGSTGTLEVRVNGLWKQNMIGEFYDGFLFNSFFRFTRRQQVKNVFARDVGNY